MWEKEIKSPIKQVEITNKWNFILWNFCFYSMYMYFCSKYSDFDFWNDNFKVQFRLPGSVDEFKKKCCIVSQRYSVPVLNIFTIVPGQ